MSNDKELDEAYKKLENISGDEKLRRLSELRLKAILDEKATLECGREAGLKEGLKEGKKDGYDSGKEEVNRLIDRSHKILEAVLNRREQILNETEEQIIQLVLLMTRKVVKVMSENQKSVVMANVLSALKKVKARGDVTIRVNLEDVKLTTEHIKDFIEQVESVSGITVVEDSSVEKGGCIVETDFGAIDARISSQLSELESKILEISPMKPIQKNPASAQTAAQK